MLDRVEEIKSKATEQLEEIESLKELEEWRVRYLGKKDTLTEILRGLGD